MIPAKSAKINRLLAPIKMGLNLPKTIISFALLGFGSAFFYDTPEDCSWSPVGDSDQVYLTCKLSSINSRLERTNFSVIPSDSTVGLRIQCTESHVGSLDTAGFSSLNLLEELVIDGCALESLPPHAFKGLVSLKRLSINTRNLSILKLQQDSFSHLPSLEKLDLSENSIREFPAGEICKLSGLQYLNLSSNKIGSILDLGHQSCSQQPGNLLHQIQILDLSNNEITSLETNSLPTSASLTELRLQKNFIRFIAPDVFSNSSIKLLDMSNNQINHLPATLFHNVPLQSLNLVNNSSLLLLEKAGVEVDKLQE